MIRNYFSGGLAEIVQKPSVLTYSFFEYWFTGEKSVGKAMQLLRLPYTSLTSHILAMREGELVVDLVEEENTLYRNTIFTYRDAGSLHEMPTLTVAPRKLFSPSSLVGTLKLLITQSNWIAKPEEMIKWGTDCLAGLPVVSEDADLVAIDKTLAEFIWPGVIAIGLLAEFYTALAEKQEKSNEQRALLHRYITKEIAKNDWFFQSYADQEKVRKGEMTFSEYIKKFGTRADNDYELTCPRWAEIASDIQKRVMRGKSPSAAKEFVGNDERLGGNKSVIQAAIAMQLLRSEVRRKALLSFFILRKSILHHAGHDISMVTRNRLLFGEKEMKRDVKATNIKRILPKKPRVTSGKGRAVMAGSAIGNALVIQENTMNVPADTIGIFPNASPYFALQYPKCKGMIFLRGGQTSHGAIVAREFGIPALIDAAAETIVAGVKVAIDGRSGEWKIIDTSS